MHGLSRRAFLRLAALAAPATLAACDPAAPAPAAVQPTPAAPTQAPVTVAPTAAPARIALDRGADVWAWQRRITGTLAGECAAAYLLVGDQRFDLSRDGERFSAAARLGEGKNQVVAACRQADGREERSNVETYTVPLRRRPTAAIRASASAERKARIYWLAARCSWSSNRLR